VPLLRTMRGAIGCSPDTLSDLDRLTLHRPLDRTGAIDSSDPQWAYGRVLRALFDIVDAVADESPLLIEIEDAHWLDATSGEVLADMMRWAKTRRVYFALTAREVPDVWSRELPAVIKELVLQPLDDIAASELLVSIAHRFGRDIDATYVQWCTSVAEGNPYFLQELAAYWGETGAQQRVPPSLITVLGRRVDKLDSDALQVLQACALLENNATLQRVEAALQFEPHRLLGAINSLGSAGMIVFEPEESDGGGQRRMSSKHDLLSNVALDQLSPPGRAYLHRRIGTVLEQEVNEHFPTAILWDCAKHWRSAGDSQRALSLALSCASHLMDVGLSKSALEVYERCISFCRSDAQRLDVLERETVALYRGSDWQRVRQTASLARVVKSRVSPDSTSHDDLELMDLRAQWQSLQWEEIATKAFQCLEETNAHPRHRVEGGIMAMMLLGFSHGKEAVIENAHGTITTLINQHQLGDALQYQAEMVYHTGFGKLEAAVTAARQLIAAHQQQGEIAELFRSYCNSSVTLRVAGLFDEAEQNLRSGLELAEKYGMDLSMIRVLPMLANMELERGNIEAARQWHSSLAALTIDSANRFGQLEAGGIGARLALLEGDGAEALRRWPLSRAEAHADSVPHRRSYNCALQTGIDLAIAGEPNVETLTILVDAYHRSKRGFHQAFCVSMIYAAFERIGERTKSEAIYQDYVANHRREPWPVPRHLIDSALNLGASLREAGLRTRPFAGQSPLSRE
jgi:tetratricopeptide (TPR) repeat protein